MRNIVVELSDKDIDFLKYYCEKHKLSKNQVIHLMINAFKNKDRDCEIFNLKERICRNSEKSKQSK